MVVWARLEVIYIDDVVFAQDGQGLPNYAVSACGSMVFHDMVYEKGGGGG